MLLKVMEKQYDDKGNLKVTTITNRFGDSVKTAEFKTYYMDLTQEEERALIATKRFGFESLRDEQQKAVTKEQIKEGLERFKQLRDILPL